MIISLFSKSTKTNWGEKIACVERWVVALLVGGLLFFSFLQIILRDFFGSGIFWSDGLLKQIVLWTSLLGAVRATAENKHIRIDLLPKFMPPKYERLVVLLSRVFSTVVLVVLLYASVIFLRNEQSMSSKAFGNVPGWWLLTIFPFSFASMALRFASQVVTDLLAGLSKNAT